MDGLFASTCIPESFYNSNDNLSTDEITMNNGMIENPNNSIGPQQQSISDATTQDTRFNKTFTNDYILMKGKSFFQQENSTASVYTKGNMDRSFIVQIEGNCFKRALDILQLTDSEIKIVKEARVLEMRRLNTKKSRSKQISVDYTNLNDVMRLQRVKSNLLNEIESLKEEIWEYKEQEGQPGDQ